VEPGFVTTALFGKQTQMEEDTITSEGRQLYSHLYTPEVDDA
jgi:hypothetical protein